ncbi:MAG TPA: hypothetical protein VFW94_09135 [Candidatus Acidoferrales bacterium]|nr:hypothetical protein [Candidatus Acidoferrales bacterium]
MALIRKQLGIEAVCNPGEHGQFDVVADGETVARRSGNWFIRQFGGGYPDLDELVSRLEDRQAMESQFTTKPTPEK